MTHVFDTYGAPGVELDPVLLQGNATSLLRIFENIFYRKFCTHDEHQKMPLFGHNPPCIYTISRARGYVEFSSRKRGVHCVPADPMHLLVNSTENGERCSGRAEGGTAVKKAPLLATGPNLYPLYRPPTGPGYIYIC